MNEHRVTLDCCLCDQKTQHVIDVPDGWKLRFAEVSVSETQVFCPDHAVIAEFVDSQCPGCVGGWGDCGLWRDFAYTGSRALTDGDFNQLRAGVCPRRVNGAIVASEGKIEDIDLSKPAPVEAGTTLVRAIKAYWERYS